jgi:serine/threonine-protein kinase
MLDRRYLIEEHLGRGGSGEVWRASDVELGLEVALKVPHCRRVERRKATRDALRREVRMAREVASRHVCRIFDLLRVEDVELLSMEYVRGITLQHLLRHASPLTMDHAHDIAMQLLSGLAAIHDVGLVHCDIKPENVMIDDAGRVVVMDFSIARALRDPAGPVSSGTPAYMAPEILEGREADSRADVFAAAVVCAEMVDPRGVRGQRARHRLWAEVHRDPPLLGSTPWQPVLSRAVSLDPEQRPGDAAALAEALSAAYRPHPETEGWLSPTEISSIAGAFDSEAGLPTPEDLPAREPGDDEPPADT